MITEGYFFLFLTETICCDNKDMDSLAGLFLCYLQRSEVLYVLSIYLLIPSAYEEHAKLHENTIKKPCLRQAHMHILN